MDNRILSYSNQFAAMKAGGFAWPQMLTLFPVYGCNFHCVGCHYNAENEAGWTFIDVDTVLRRLDEMKAHGLRAVSMCGGGEPTLHPKIMDLVRGIRSRGLAVGVITNGTRLVTNSAVRELFLSEAEFIRVSIWPETDIAKTVTLSTFPRRNEMGARCLISKASLDFYRRVVPQLIDGGWTYIDVKAERDSPDNPQDLGVEWADEILEEFKSLSPIIRGNLRKTSTKTTCYLTSVHAFVDGEGLFKACCFFQGRKEEHTFGSIYDDKTFEDIWLGQGHERTSAAIKQHDCNKWDCRFFGYLRISEAFLDGQDPRASIQRQDFASDDFFI